MAHDAFLSYSAADKATTQAVLEGLEGQGIRCWIAPRDVPAGSEYGEEIVEAIKGCRVVVLVFSASANSSPHVRREVERAVSAGRTILTFRVEDVAPTGAMEYALGNTHWLDAFTRPLEPHVTDLVATVQRLTGTTTPSGVAAPTAPATAHARPPAERPSIVDRWPRR